MSIFDGLTFDFDKFAGMDRCVGKFGGSENYGRGCTLTALWYGLGVKSEWLREKSNFIHPITGDILRQNGMCQATEEWAKSLGIENFCKQIVKAHDGYNEADALSLVFKLLRAAKLYPLQPQEVVQDAAPEKAPTGLLV